MFRRVKPTANYEQQLSATCISQARKTPFEQMIERKRMGSKQRIWRYMDFTKFFSVISRKALFLPCLALLDDVTEGKTYSQTEFLGELKKVLKSKRSPPRMVKSTELLTMLNDLEELSKDYICVSCWHENSAESSHMWKRYVRSGNGVVLVSDAKTLFRYLDFPSVTCSAGSVSYARQPQGELGHAFYKRRHYSKEKEVRVLVDLRSVSSRSNHTSIKQLRKYRGIFVPVRLNKILHEIRFSPGADVWFRELVADSLRMAKLSNVSLRRSELEL